MVLGEDRNECSYEERMSEQSKWGKGRKCFNQKTTVAGNIHAEIEGDEDS